MQEAQSAAPWGNPSSPGTFTPCLCVLLNPNHVLKLGICYTLSVLDGSQGELLLYERCPLPGERPFSSLDSFPYLVTHDAICFLSHPHRGRLGKAVFALSGTSTALYL